MSDRKVEGPFVYSRVNRGDNSYGAKCSEPDVSKGTSENGPDIIGA